MSERPRAGPWSRFVGWCHRPVDARPAALVRILLCAVLLWDHGRLALKGLVPLLYSPADHGGFVARHSPWYVLDLLGPSGGIVGWVGMVACLLAALVGFKARWTLLAAALLYAQLDHGFHWDNGGDRIARTVMVLLALSGAGWHWSLDRREGSETMAAWPVDLLRWLLLLIYLGAGLAKLFPRPLNWMSIDYGLQTYRIMTYPITSDWSATTWIEHRWLLYGMDVATIVVELSAFLIVTRWRQWWALTAAPIHLGIALGMTIDPFAFIMLALYPVLFDQWIVRGGDKLRSRRVGPTG